MRHPGSTAGAEAARVAPASNERDSYRLWYPVPAPVPVPAGLSGAETAAVEASLDASPGAWCAVRHGDEAGEISVVAVARDAADDAAPTHVVHRDGALPRLDVCRGDAYSRLVAYGAMAPLTRALAAALAGARAGG